MSTPGDPGFDERRKAALKAKSELLKKFKAAPGLDDAEVQKKQAERKAIADAREVRRAEREQAKREAAERQKLETERQQAESEKQRAEAEDAAGASASERAIEERAARKAERDRRYAARKARQR